METALLVIAGVRALVELMKIAETVFAKPQQGQVKKEWVTQCLQHIVSGLLAGSTGGQKETWEEITKNWPILSAGLGDCIDFLAGALFPQKESAK